jgi:hypothetical protein
MPEFCSCGAQLPPDARFCHKCGKPQGSDPIFEPETAIPPEPAAAAPHAAPAALDFHNPVAVRVGLSMASLATLLTCLPFVNLGFLLWWLAAGFFSVYMYRRRTGQQLTVRGGVRLGWITGIFTFAIMTVLFTISIIPVAVSKGGLGNFFQQSLHSMPGNDPSVQEALRMFETPAGIASILLAMLVMFFVFITLLCTAGGALGAKFAGRQE